MAQETFSVALLEPEVRRQDVKISRLRRRSPRTWPLEGEDILAWRAETISQILEPGFQPLGATRAPTFFIALITEICTEVRLGTSDAELEWDRDPADPSIHARICVLKAAVERGIDRAKAMAPESAMEEEIRDLYVMHMDARRELLEVLVNESLEVPERRSTVLKLRSVIREKEVEKSRELPRILRGND